MLNRQGRPTSALAAVADPAAGMADESARAAGDVPRPAPGGTDPHPTFTGNKALAPGKLPGCSCARVLQYCWGDSPSPGDART